jgi:hypothetical protein
VEEESREELMGVTIRERKDRQDGVWWVFVSHFNRRTSFKVGSKQAAEDVQHELQVMLALDRALNNLRPRGGPKPLPLSSETRRQAIDLRARLSRLLARVDEALRHNETERVRKGRKQR